MKRLFTAFAKARTASALSQLSDKTLDDIGIERHQIWSHVEKIYA